MIYIYYSICFLTYIVYIYICIYIYISLYLFPYLFICDYYDDAHEQNMIAMFIIILLTMIIIKAVLNL